MYISLHLIWFFVSISAYFKHPRHLCSPTYLNNVPTGKGLFIQTGYDPIRHHEQIPLEEQNLSPLWKKALCLPTMGTARVSLNYNMYSTIKFLISIQHEYIQFLTQFILHKQSLIVQIN